MIESEFNELVKKLHDEWKNELLFEDDERLQVITIKIQNGKFITLNELNEINENIGKNNVYKIKVYSNSIDIEII